MYSSTDLSFSYQDTGDLLSPPDLPRAQGAFRGEVKAQAVCGDQRAPLVGLPQNSPQGKVQDVCGGVVAHDESTTGLERECERLLSQRGDQTARKHPETVKICSHLIYVQDNVVSDLQCAVNCPHVENVTPSDLCVLHSELHPLQKKKERRHD